MRWRKHMVGQTRTRAGFLFLPRKMPVLSKSDWTTETRWLERASWLQMLVEVVDYHDGGFGELVKHTSYVWKDEYWMSV